MERTQISLEPDQADRLRRLARDRGVSMAHLIRDAVDLAYGGVTAPATHAERRARALTALASGRSGLDDISERHDDYLDDAFGS
jgi:hypothetical protein